MKRIVYSPIIADLFHYGHLQSLKFAREQGDYLICGVLTDKAALYHKEVLVSNFDERKAIIKSLNFVYDVMDQDNKDPTENLKKLHKKFKNCKIILVHGDDWREITGSKFIKQIGGKVITHPYYTRLSDLKIMNGLLKRYEGRFNIKDFTYFNPKKVEGAIFSSKADTLMFLKDHLKKSKIEKIFVFTVFDWMEMKNEIMNKIRRTFDSSKVIIRSSTLGEDADEGSMAGAFHSELDVPSGNKVKLYVAISEVIRSYGKKESNAAINQILVQKQTTDVSMSGVIFTRTINNNSPYYVINYDDKTGSTESVTKGIEGKTVRIHRSSKLIPKKFSKLMEAIKEIEELIPHIALDIEFAIKNNRIIIFQIRPITTKGSVDDNEVDIKLQSLKKQFVDLSKKNHLAGKKNCFGDMPDWNPAEIIGDNPNHLDYSLYDYIITDSAWHEARSSQGYTNVNPAKLVILFGNKPFIDIKNTFNSFIPVAIKGKLREKLINFYMDKLTKNPEMQDKVEFEILHTCYCLSFDKKSKELLNHGFTKEEVYKLRWALINLTNNFLTNYKETIKKDMDSIFNMQRLRSVWNKTPKSKLNEAKSLLDDCRKNGTVQFSRLARLAFVGTTIFKSLVAEKIIDESIYNSFMNSINTVAKKMGSDFNLYASGRMKKKDFLEIYGHLRPGTYDITSCRYDKDTDILSINKHDFLKQKQEEFKIGSYEGKINKRFKKHNLHITCKELFDFTKSAIESRELAKFQFTKTLSDAIELIKEAGSQLGVSKELSQLDVNTLFNHMDKSDKEIADIWKDIIKKRLIERDLNNHIILPPIIFSEDDFDIISYYSPKPNFITQKHVTGELVNINKEKTRNLNGKIVLLENGDPGYDWIFTKNPAGLITKYGGIASHMSIRAAEFGLPAAIGCGEIFDKIKNNKTITLDCEHKKIK